MDDYPMKTQTKQSLPLFNWHKSFFVYFSFYLLILFFTNYISSSFSVFKCCWFSRNIWFLLSKITESGDQTKDKHITRAHQGSGYMCDASVVKGSLGCMACGYEVSLLFITLLLPPEPLWLECESWGHFTMWCSEEGEWVLSGCHFPHWWK